jgi:hypothetical protein
VIDRIAGSGPWPYTTTSIALGAALNPALRGRSCAGVQAISYARRTSGSARAGDSGSDQRVRRSMPGNKRSGPRRGPERLFSGETRESHISALRVGYPPRTRLTGQGKRNYAKVRTSRGRLSCAARSAQRPHGLMPMVLVARLMTSPCPICSSMKPGSRTWRGRVSARMLWYSWDSPFLSARRTARAGTRGTETPWSRRRARRRGR